jgi:hypothetical protein
MSRNDSLAASPDDLGDLPAFDLAYDVDDEAEPTRVVVYAETDDAVATRWLSVDADCAVSLDDVA